MIKYHQIGNKVIAELNDANILIRNAEDATDLIGDIGSSGCSRIIIPEENMHPDFFDLRNGIAGEILQKFSNYRFKVAVTGKFERFQKKSTRDFIRESNRGNLVCFVEDVETAIAVL